MEEGSISKDDLRREIKDFLQRVLSDSRASFAVTTLNKNDRFSAETISQYFPRSSFNKEKEYKQFLECIVAFSFKDTIVGKKPLFDCVNLEDKSRIDLVSLFTQFSICVGSFISMTPQNIEFMQEVLILCQLFMRCVQRHASEYIGKRADPDSPSLNSSFVEDSAQACHRLANKFVVDCFPQYIKELKK